MRYLHFDFSEGDDGVTTLDALASTQAAQRAAVQAEAEAVLAWCRREFPQGPGPLDEGHDWDADLSQVVEAGGWHTLSLTLSGRPHFAQAVLAEFPQ